MKRVEACYCPLDHGIRDGLGLAILEALKRALGDAETAVTNMIAFDVAAIERVGALLSAAASQALE
ncbi:MAG TPA: hypothetical protein VK762_17555 [Polyangiaceae bacterium]|jgi:hypothetical protein|nr:hypothetical protein [Polyangiaceae bacterium]